MQIGKELKAFRQKQHLSQIEFAERIGSTQQCVSNYERGVVEPSIDLLMRISGTFHCSVDEIIGNPTGEMEREAVELLHGMPEGHRTLSIQILRTIHDIGPEGINGR